MFASCGQERDVVLWQGNTMRRVGDLVGHTASVVRIALDERLNHVFTLAADRVIKVCRGGRAPRQGEWAHATSTGRARAWRPWPTALRVVVVGGERANRGVASSGLERCNGPRQRAACVFAAARAGRPLQTWDLRNHKCLQTLTEDDWRRPEETKPHTLFYDSAHRRCVTGTSKPYVWMHKMVTQDRTGHMDAVRAALFNNVFGVIVTVDEGGTVCVWNLDGHRCGGQGRWE
jgi:hypothetical protein